MRRRNRRYLKDIYTFLLGFYPIGNLVKLYIIYLFTSVVLLGQTKINGSVQFKNPDFSTQSFSRPWPSGAALPVACRVGEVFFVDNSQTGQKLHLCMQNNIWAEMYPNGGQSGGGESGQTSNLADWNILRVSATQLSIGSLCTAAKPCRGRVGTKQIVQTQTAIVQLLGPLGTGNLYVWLDEGGLKVGHDSQATVSCNAYCTVHSQVSEFPVFGIPIASIPFGSNVFAALTPEMDKRAFLFAPRWETGPSGNVRLLNNAATGSFSIDLSPVLDLSGLERTRVTKTGTNAQRPAQCLQGDLFYQTDSQAGLYHCASPNQWETVGGSSLSSMEFQVDGQPIGSRGKLNLSAVSGISLNCADDSQANRVSCAFSMSAPDLNSVYGRLNAPNTFGSSATIDLSAASTATGLRLPTASTAAPTASGQIAFSTNDLRVWAGANGTARTLAWRMSGANAGRPTSTCLPGDTYYQTDGVAGLYINSAVGTCTWSLSGAGDVSGAVSSTNGNVAIFSGGSGRQLADGGKTLPSGAIVGTTDTQTLTGKTLAAPVIASYTVATLPPATSAGQVVVVSDASARGSCSIGGGTEISLCRATGTIWIPLGDGGAQLLNITLSSPSTIAASTTGFITNGAVALSGSESERRAYAPYPITIDRLHVITASAQPGSSPSHDMVCTVSVNNVNSSLAVTISGGSAAGTFNNSSASVSLGGGSYWQIGCTNSSSNPSASIRGFALRVRAQ